MAQSLQFSFSLLSPNRTKLPSKQTIPKPYFPTSRGLKISPIRSEISAPSTGSLVSNGATRQGSSMPPFLPPRVVELGAENDVDRGTENELKEKTGFRSTRKTKLVCTIGPATCGLEELEALAVCGMNVATLNMCHGTQEWHRSVIERVGRLNENGFAV